jgi:two-component system, chemotaxis family, chemotaxis protein CheY
MATILLVDDNDVVRMALREVLLDAGYVIYEACDGVEALEVYRKNPCDLIVTDLEMPRKNGLEFIMDLWQEFPHVKVIAISGSKSAAEPELSLEFAQICGALHTFTKPVAAQDLLDKVKEYLS